MAILPFNKYFRFVKGGTFTYTWQYLIGIPDAAQPFNLTNYTGTWTIHAPTGDLTYSTGALAGHSGVFFGSDPTLGEIQLLVSSVDTAAFTWTTAPYTFSIRDTSNPPVVTPLLAGSISSVLTLP